MIIIVPLLISKCLQKKKNSVGRESSKMLVTIYLLNRYAEVAFSWSSKSRLIYLYLISLKYFMYIRYRRKTKEYLVNCLSNYILHGLFLIILQIYFSKSIIYLSREFNKSDLTCLVK